jgi:hypothetical protein
MVIAPREDRTMEGSELHGRASRASARRRIGPLQPAGAPAASRARAMLAAVDAEEETSEEGA